ncbi:hypothetical protein J7E93_12565 [Streptomyces sp. ISL-36]|uniref:hypothetical protein n=1 Tax=Streptomyces sp. ISL-36 TaxID=2819182 RepID=UPI001BE759DD|nr:hypothetical protein [Streptomyces sp. ISL-36]MBT2440931.1 hypothetical protein [Streptomyces sp. ISL-36]
MYLIHAHLEPPPGAAVPVDADTRVCALGRPEERVRHGSLHADAQPHPVLGLFVAAPSLAAAEAVAREVCERALDLDPALRGIRLLRCEAPLVAPYYEGLLTPPAVD